MELTQLLSLGGAFVVLLGLLKLHKFVVKKHVLPNVVDEEIDE